MFRESGQHTKFYLVNFWCVLIFLKHSPKTHQRTIRTKSQRVSKCLSLDLRPPGIWCVGALWKNVSRKWTTHQILPSKFLVCSHFPETFTKKWPITHQSAPTHQISEGLIGPLERTYKSSTGADLEQTWSKPGANLITMHVECI